MRIILMLLLCCTSLVAFERAVIFDYGDVLAFHNQEILNQFLCKSLQMTNEEFKKAKDEKKTFGESDEIFWIGFAKKIGVKLPLKWQQMYREALRDSLGANRDMYCIVDELNKKGVKVGLLSNIEKKYAIVAKGFGFFESFNPCLLTCDMGVQKPEPKAYQMLLESIDIEPMNVVFIDDNHTNVEAAKKVGLDGIVFESPDQVRIELQKRGLL